MTNVKITQIANKIANKHNDAWHKQRQVLESFYYDTSKFFKSLVSEMDGDLLLLKQLGVDLSIQKMLGQIFHKLIELYKDIDPQHPYLGIQKLIDWANSKENKIIFENLNFLINEYLMQTKTDFEQTKNLKHPRAQSIKKLINVLPKLTSFMANHPLLPDPASISTVPPPNKNIEMFTLNPEDETKVFSKAPSE